MPQQGLSVVVMVTAVKSAFHPSSVFILLPCLRGLKSKKENHLMSRFRFINSRIVVSTWCVQTQTNHSCVVKDPATQHTKCTNNTNAQFSYDSSISYAALTDTVQKQKANTQHATQMIYNGEQKQMPTDRDKHRRIQKQQQGHQAQ